MRASVPLAIIDAGAGNLRSVAKALAAVGGEPIITDDPDVVRRADRLVFPGQGAFRDAMARLLVRGLDEALREKLDLGTPYLGICLGLQILFEESEEQGPVVGLGIVAGRVVRLSPGRPALKVPHVGWNALSLAAPRDRLLDGIDDGAHAYFVHSYHAIPDVGGLVVARADHGGLFCAALRQDNVFACQFHPEKSQHVGLRILANFLREE